MGLMRHHAIVVTSWQTETIHEVHELAVATFGRLVTPIVESYTNGYLTFFVGPDGSKEGWDTSDAYDRKREEFMDHLKTRAVNAAEVQYFSETGVTWVREEHEPRPEDEAR